MYLPLSGGIGLKPGIERGMSASLIPGSARSVSQSGGAPSPMMDAPYSPGVLPNAGLFGSAVSGTTGFTGGDARVKIGQTSLHNPGGQHSWVGL